MNIVFHFFHNQPIETLNPTHLTVKIAEGLMHESTSLSFLTPFSERAQPTSDPREEQSEKHYRNLKCEIQS